MHRASYGFDMAEMTVNTLGADELLALKFVALEGGLAGSAKVSCAGLGERLDASNQTASRRLQRLEAGGYVDRDIVTDGQWVAVTDAGERALRSEYADYRRLFDPESSLTLTGSITTGMGEGRHYISLSGYQRQFETKLGYTPFPGTLNVELDEASVRSRAALSTQRSIRIDSWEDDERTFGAATCYPARVVADGGAFEPTHVIVPDRTHHDEAKLELIAPVKLRDELELTDGDTLEIHLSEATDE